MESSSTKPSWRHQFRTPRKVRRKRQKQKQKHQQVQRENQQQKDIGLHLQQETRTDDDNPTIEVASTQNLDTNEVISFKRIETKSLLTRQQEKNDQSSSRTSLKPKRRKGSGNESHEINSDIIVKHHTLDKDDSKTRNDETSQNNIKPASKPRINSTTSSSPTFTSNTLVADKIKIEKQYHIHSSDIPVTYEIMRSIVTAITFIEQRNGFNLDNLYIMPETIKINGNKFNNRLYQQLQPFVNQCIDYMIQGRIQQVEELESILISISSKLNFECDDENSCHVVAMSILGLLQCCEVLVPDNVHASIMNIMKEDHIQKEETVEEILSNPDWSQLKSMTFISILHHLAKLWKVRCNLLQQDNVPKLDNREEQSDDNGMEYIRKVAKVFAKVLLVRQPTTIVGRRKRRTINFFVSKKNQYKAETRVLLLMISSMIMMNNDAQGQTRKFNSRNGTATRVSSPDEIKQQTSFSSNRANLASSPSSSRKSSCDDDENNEDSMRTSNPSITSYEINRNDNKKQRKNTQKILTPQPPQDEGNGRKIKYIPNHYHNDPILTKAKQRLELAELILDRIDTIIPLK